ncbi:MAG: hypothetical protein VB877_08415 [Pirellulaceae bacterium]
MKKISQTWLFAVVTILALLVIHRLGYELISYFFAGDIFITTRLLLGIPFRILSCVLLISCLFTSFLLPSLQLFLVRKEINGETLASILLGALLGPISILLVVTLIVHDLDGGELLILAVLATPIITLLALATLYLYSRHRPGRTSKIT